MNSQEYWVKECLGKKRYRTLGFAEDLAKKIKKEREVELYVYSCPSCQGFHLTKRKEYKNRYEILRVC